MEKQVDKHIYQTTVSLLFIVIYCHLLLFIVIYCYLLLFVIYCYLLLFNAFFETGFANKDLKYAECVYLYLYLDPFSHSYLVFSFTYSMKGVRATAPSRHNPIRVHWTSVLRNNLTETGVLSYFRVTSLSLSLCVFIETR